MTKSYAERKTLVARLLNEIALVTREMHGVVSDKKMNQLAEELFAATANLAHAPAVTEKDLAAKLEVLCQRLREFLDPDQRGKVLTVLLAESIRDDVSLRLSASSRLRTD